MIGRILTAPVRWPARAIGGIAKGAQGMGDKLTPAERGEKERGMFSHIKDAASIFTPAHWREVPDGIKDLAWDAPKHLGYHGLYESIAETFIQDARAGSYDGVRAATREELGGLFGHVKESFAVGLDTEIFQDIATPIVESGKYIGRHVFGSAWNLIMHPLSPASYVRLVAGVATTIPTIMMTTAKGVALLIPDIASLPFRAFGATGKLLAGGLRRPFAVAEQIGKDIPVWNTINKYTTGTFRRFFAAAEHFSEETMITADYVERGLDRTIVPIGMREGRSTYSALEHYGGGMPSQPMRRPSPTPPSANGPSPAAASA